MYYLQNRVQISVAGLQAPTQVSPNTSSSDYGKFTSHLARRSVLAWLALTFASLFTTAHAQQFDFTSTPGINPTQFALAEGLDNACNAISGSASPTPGQADLLATCNALNAAPVSTVQRDLLILSPDDVGAQSTVAVEIFNAQIANVVQRLALLKGGIGGIGVASLHQDPSQRMLAATDTDGLALGELDEDNAESERLGVFITANGGTGDRDETSAEPGFDFDTKAVTAGLDYRFLDNLVLGAAASYTRIDADLEALPVGGGGGEVDVDGYSVSLFGTYYLEDRFYIDGIASVGSNEFDTRRGVVFGDVTQQAASDPDSEEYAVGIGSGYDFNFDQLTVGPFGQVNYVRVDIDAIEEQAARGGSLGAGSVTTIEDQDVETLTSVLGGQASYAISSGVGVFAPQFRAGWVHEFELEDREISAQFLNDPSNTGFVLPADDPDSDYFTAAVGVSGTFTRSIAAFLQYEKLLGHSYLDQDLFTGGIRLSF